MVVVLLTAATLTPDWSSDAKSRIDESAFTM